MFHYRVRGGFNLHLSIADGHRLAVNCWPSPSNEGTCDVNIEYELENEQMTLYDVVISIPLP